MYKISISILFFIFSATAFGKANIFYQDNDFIYRSVPDAIDVTDTELMTKLINAATEEVLQQTEIISEQLDGTRFGTTLEEVQAQIAAYLDIEENIDALNLQVETFKNSKEAKGWGLDDLLPKGLTVFIGLSGSASAGISFSGSLALGLNIVIDKVDKISKKDLVNFLDEDSNFTAGKIADIFEEVDNSSFVSETKLLLNTIKGGRKTVLRSTSGKKLSVLSYYDIDTAPVVIAAPAVGVGVGGGTAVRFGVAASWWRGNKIFEPEDLYGLGISYSQDLSLAGAGYNLKLGIVNSENAAGWIDYFYTSFSIGFGPQTEFSPVKGNVLFMQQPLWLIEKLGLSDKAEKLIDRRLEESFGKKWEEVTGIPNNGRRKPRQPSINREVIRL